MRKILVLVLAVLAFGFTPAAYASTPSPTSPYTAPAQHNIPRLSSTAVRWIFADRACMDYGAYLIRAWRCNGGASQSWMGLDTVAGNAHELIAVSNRRCVYEPSSANWSRVEEVALCTANYRAESWNLVPRYGGWELKNVWSGKCLQDGNNAFGVILTVYTCNGSWTQEVTPFSEGVPI